MKKIITIMILALVLCAAAFAQSISESASDETTADTKPVFTDTVSEEDQAKVIGFDPYLMFSAFLARAADVELPEGVILPENMSSEDAIQLVLYLMGNKIDVAELEELIRGSIDNGEFGEMTPLNDQSTETDQPNQ